MYIKTPEFLPHLVKFVPTAEIVHPKTPVDETQVRARQLTSAKCTMIRRYEMYQPSRFEYFPSSGLPALYSMCLVECPGEDSLSDRLGLTQMTRSPDSLLPNTLGRWSSAQERINIQEFVVQSVQCVPQSRRWMLDSRISLRLNDGPSILHESKGLSLP